MRLLAIFALSLGILGCMAQESTILSPTSGQNFSPNQPLVVQVSRAITQQGITEVGMVIGLLQCQEDPCPPPDNRLGTVLFKGHYDPVSHGTTDRQYQNITLDVPALQGNGTKAQLTAARFYLKGFDEMSHVLEVNTVALNIVFN